MEPRLMVDELDDRGFVVLERVLAADETATARGALVEAAAESERRGVPTRMLDLDPGGRNVRVYDLIDFDPVFADLAMHPVVVDAVVAAIGGDWALSNFTANIAQPGSRSMNAHCDQSTVMPEPWPRRDTVNAIWCLDDIDASNGATRYLPGSHRFTSFADVPDDPTVGMASFEAAAGSVVLIDGRLWHTSGENTTADRERALLFAFYARDYLALQNNWWRSLSRDRQRELAPDLKARLGLAFPNIAHGTYLAER